MTVIDPHGTLPTPIGGPFDNAFAVDLDALQAGNTIELPFVSSALIIGGQPGINTMVACKVKLVGSSPDDGFYISLKGNQTLVVPVRATHILPIIPGDIGYMNPDKPNPPIYPSTITALW